MVKVFCDFDGTISLNDVGNEFFTRFTNGKAKKFVDLWKAGKIDSKEMYLHSVEQVNISLDQLSEFVNSQKIDPFFFDFVKLCETGSDQVSIVSDGMDFYIQPLLLRNELDYLTVYSNKLFWRNGKLKAEFPYYEWSCGKCANCKGYHLRLFKELGNELILIGDGLSDVCAVKEADIIFAKNDLAKYCVKNRIEFIEFQNFSDIIDQFNKKVNLKKGG